MLTYNIILLIASFFMYCTQHCVKLKELHFPVENTAGKYCIYVHSYVCISYICINITILYAILLYTYIATYMYKNNEFKKGSRNLPLQQKVRKQEQINPTRFNPYFSRIIE